MKTKSALPVSFLILVVGTLFSGVSFAEKYDSVADGTVSAYQINLIEKERTCYTPLLEELKSKTPNENRIKNQYASALTCVDSCITPRDAFYIADNCYDWESLYKIIQGKSDLHSVLSYILGGKLIRCSAKDLALAEHKSALDGIYYDVSKKSCSSTVLERYAEEYRNLFPSLIEKKYLNRLSIVLGFLTIATQENTYYGAQASLFGYGYKNTEHFLFSWTYKLDNSVLVPDHKEASRDQVLYALQADLETSVYKTFGKSFCTPIVGIENQSQGKLQADKNGIRPLAFKQAYTSLKGAFGISCTNDHEFNLRFEIQNDLIRISAFSNPNLFAGYTFIGQQVGLKLQGQFADAGFTGIEIEVANHKIPHSQNLIEFGIKGYGAVNFYESLYGGLSGEYSLYHFGDPVNESIKNWQLSIFGGGIW